MKKLSWLKIIGILLMLSNPAAARAIKLSVKRDGIVKVTYRMIGAVIPQGEAKIPSAGLALSRRGKSVPIHIVDGGDGSFDPGDYFIFLGEENKSPYTKTSVYWLSFSGSGARIDALGSGLKDFVPTGPDTGNIKFHWERELIPRESMDREEWEKNEAPSWVAASLRGLNPAWFTLPGAPVDPARGKLRVRLVRDEVNPMTFRLLLGGKPFEPRQWNEKRAAVFEFDLDPEHPLDFAVSMTCESQKCNAVYLDWVEVETEIQLPVANADLLRRPESIQFVPAREVRKNDGDAKNPNGSSDESNARHWEENNDPLAIPTLTDYLVITRREFMPEATRLAEYRRSRGLNPALVAIEDIFDELNFGEFSPVAIRDFIRRAAGGPVSNLRYIVLIGDAVGDVDFGSFQAVVPTFRVLDSAEVLVGSDNPYADLNDDGAPELALGRIPARSLPELKTVIDKIMAYETALPHGAWRRRMVFTASEANFGPWLDKVIEDNVKRILGGLVPPQFDAEMTYGSPKMPYIWIPEEFHDKVVERINLGAILFNYIGHGGPGGLDSVHWGDKYYDMFEEADIPFINTQGRFPLVLIIACLTGQFDSNVKAHSFTESLLLSPTAAIAAIGASVISSPYSNAVLEIEFLKALMDRKNAVIGDVLLAAKRGLTSESSGIRAELSKTARVFMSPDLQKKELMDHILMYNLMGDPALKIGFPEFKVDLAAEKTECRSVIPGRQSGESGKNNLVGQPPPADESGEGARPTTDMDCSIQVTGAVAEIKSGKALVTLEYDRIEILADIEPVAPGDLEYKEKIASNWNKANNKVLASVVVDVIQGKFKTQLPVPGGLKPGVKYYVKAYVTGAPGQGDAMGVQPVEINLNP